MGWQAVIRHLWFFFFWLISAVAAAETTAVVSRVTATSITPPDTSWNFCATNVVTPVLESFIGTNYNDTFTAAATVDAAMPDTDSCVGSAHQSTIFVGRASGNQVFVNYRRDVDGKSMYWYLVFAQSTGCPDSSWTLNGGQCERPDCPSGQPRQPDGSCDNPCQSKAGQNASDVYAYSWTDSTINASVGDVICIDKCAADVVFAMPPSYQCSFGSDGFGACVTTHAVQSMFNGSTCAGMNPEKTGEQTPSKQPPCNPTQGVLTSDSGTVACVPEGTPDSRPPEVEQKKKKETFPDGSEKQTDEITTKDPKTGATSTKTTSTSTGGQSGPAGTTTSTSTSGLVGGTAGNGNGDGNEGDCEGDNCAPGEFPDTDGLYEKKYENGIKGVLNARYTQLRESPLFQLANTLAPTNVPNSGACSPFSLSMNIGPGMNFGGGSIEVPCYVWSFIRIVMLISAFLLARRLIFGG